MIGNPLNRTSSIIEQSGRRKKLEISVKRRFYPDHNTGLLVPIDCEPQDARIYSGYKFEVVKHDLHLAFAPSSKRLPFLRITDPKSEGSWALWFMGFGDNITPSNPIAPMLVDKGNNFVRWRLDNNSSLKLDIMGHMIRKLIILDERPSWNVLKFRIARGGASLIDGMAVGQPERRLMAFRKGGKLGIDNPLFWFTEPNAYDSSGVLNPDYTKPKYTLTPIFTGVWELTIELDTDWLDSAKYPVHIDPTIVLQPDPTEGYDNYFADVSAGTNHGATIFLAFTYCRGSVVYNSAQTLIKFDLSSIPIGSTINTATLTFHRYGGYYQPTANNIPVYILRLLKDWKEGSGPHHTQTGESDETYYDKPSMWNNYCANGLNSDYIDDGDAPYIWTDIPSILELQLPKTIQGIISSGNNYGFKISTINADGYDTGTYATYYLPYSSDHSSVYERPSLTIDYTEASRGMPAKLGALAGKNILNPLATGTL